MKPATLAEVNDGPILARLRTEIELGPHKLYSGANRYHSSAVMALQLDLGPAAEITTAQLPAYFCSAFLERFQKLPSFLPGNGISKSFATALGSGSSIDLAEVMLEAILAIEHSINFSQHDLHIVSFAAIDRDAELPVLVWETSKPKISLQSAEIALFGVTELFKKSPANAVAGDESRFGEALGILRETVRRKRLAPATAMIRLEAATRGIPCQTLGRQHLLLGEGYLQHHYYASMTDSTSIAAQKICSDKRQTNRRLSDLRLPVPRQVKIGTLDAAKEAAIKIGFPLVIKPVRGKKGRGISVGLGDMSTIEGAFDLAHKSGADVLIEEFVPGLDFRLLVIGGRFVAAVYRRTPSIIGDGSSTVEALIDAENENPYRDGFRGFKIDKDDEVLRHLRVAGLSLQDVPRKGQEIPLRTAANVSTGGLPVDVTDHVHPDAREMAERASQGVGLDVAGVDFITPDIARSYHEVGGAIVEINARPGLDIHTWPVAGKSRNVAGMLLDQTFYAGKKGRLPTAIVCGDRGTGTVARSLERLLRGAKRAVALTLRDRYYTDGMPATWTGRQQSRAQQVLLRDPAIDTLVSTVSLRQTAESGMSLETASVGIILDRAKNGRADLFHLGVEIVAKATAECLVIGAGNLVAQEILSAQETKRLILVSNRGNDAALRSHLDDNGVAVTMQWRDGENHAVILSGQDILSSFGLGKFTLAENGARKLRLETALLYAIAAAIGLGLTPAQIEESLLDEMDMVDAD